MPVDNTLLFKACVKTVRAKKKMMGEEDREKNLLRTKPHSRFIMQSLELTKQITQLRDCILENRKAYLNFTPSFVNTDQMTDEVRDSIDSNAQQIIKSSSYFVASLKSELKNVSNQTQAYQSNRLVLELVENYLKVICKLITDQMTLRVKWKSELQKITQVNSPPVEEAPVRVKPDVLLEKDSKKASFVSSVDSSADDCPLSDEEVQVFELENDLLFNDLNSLNEEVQSIKGKIVKIAELQEVFSEKVLEQNDDLARINTTLVGSTENIRDANKQIREAIQNHAGLRIYVLFFLLMMSFSLLFLDWYND